VGRLGVRVKEVQEETITGILRSMVERNGITDLYVGLKAELVRAVRPLSQHQGKHWQHHTASQQHPTA
jgi:hypothetical protein